MKKKLLILGGSQISLQILYAAKEMGVEVYVTDYYENSPCKALADKSFMISATDIDAVVDLINKEHIDGVLMGYADVLMPYYDEICKRSGLPRYSNRNAIDITTDKAVFKKYCKEYGVPTVEEYTIQQVRIRAVKFPVIVKPVDNSGARGIYICNNIEEFETNYHKALSFSKSGNVIIERMMTGTEATIFYYFHDGVPYLLGVADRWMYQQNDKLLKLPVGYTFPSKNISQYINSEDQAIKRMFNSLDMKEGMVFLQSFVENGTYIIYEMGYRLTGSIEHHCFDRQYGFNHLKAIIDFSIGNRVDSSIVKSINPMECNMANVTLLLKKGTIASIEGLDQVKLLPEVVSYHLSYGIGDKIDDSVLGKLAQVGVRVLLVAKSHVELINAMDTVKDLITIIDDKGNDMIIRDYSYKELCV